MSRGFKTYLAEPKKNGINFTSKFHIGELVLFLSADDAETFIFLKKAKIETKMGKSSPLYYTGRTVRKYCFQAVFLPGIPFKFSVSKLLII